MLNERLKMVPKLLKDDGVIFVSINDYEYAYLKVMMDEILGENNFVCHFVWEKKNSGSADDATHIKVLTEYVLMYAYNKEKLKTSSYMRDVEDGSYKQTDEYVETRGKYKLKQLDFSSLTYSKDLDYEFIYEGIKYYPSGSYANWKKRHSGQHAGKDWQWRWSKSKLEWGIENGFVVFKDNKIYTKQYQFVDHRNQQLMRTAKYDNLILGLHGSIGTDEQVAIFGTKVFDHPKPVDLIKFLINLHPNKNARVLDFYAGSGTTGHAVLELNREDGGNRTFTLVTNNENKIGENVCYERLYRVNQGFSTKKSNKIEWTKYNTPFRKNLKVFSIEYYDISLFDKNKTTTEKIYLDYNQCLIDNGLLTLNNDQSNGKNNIKYNLMSLYPMKKQGDQ